VATEPRAFFRIDQVLDRTDLRVLLNEFAQPAGSGRLPKWHCPVSDHDDHNASVTMYRDWRGHERWRCWSGDNSHRGDAVDLVQVVRRCDRSDAVQWLADRMGILPDEPMPRVRRRQPPPERQLVELDDAVKQYVVACQRVIHSSAGRPVRDWLAARGLGSEVLQANGVGADPGRRMLPRVRGLPWGAGPAATFPALDQAGELRYVQTRYLEPGERGKYDNPAAYMGTNPRMAWTKPVGPRRDGVLVVCEGIPDALTAAQVGCTAVGVLGAQLPDGGVATRLVTRAEREGLTLVAVVDADDPGRQWGERLGELVKEQGMSLTVVEPPAEGLDLNAWAARDEQWTTALPSAGDSSRRRERLPDRAVDVTE
jgi:hypothetical protein